MQKLKNGFGCHNIRVSQPVGNGDGTDVVMLKFGGEVGIFVGELVGLDDGVTVGLDGGVFVGE